MDFYDYLYHPFLIYSILSLAIILTLFISDHRKFLAITIALNLSAIVIIFFIGLRLNFWEYTGIDAVGVIPGIIVPLMFQDAQRLFGIGIFLLINLSVLYGRVYFTILNRY